MFDNPFVGLELKISYCCEGFVNEKLKRLHSILSCLQLLNLQLIW
jgi:hypothetical protein